MKNLLLILSIVSLAHLSWAQVAAIDLYRVNSAIDQRSYGQGVIKTLVEGDNYLRQAQWERAIIAYDVAVTQWPNWAPAYIKRAMAKMRMGRQTEADQDMAKAYQISANSVLLFSERNPGAKLSLLLTNINDSPIDWQFNLAEINELKRQGKMAQAAVEIEKLYDNQVITNLESALLKGNIHFLKDDYLTAVAYYDWVLNHGLQANLLHNRGLAHIRSYNFADGCADLLQAGEMGHTPSFQQHTDLCSF